MLTFVLFLIQMLRVSNKYQMDIAYHSKDIFNKCNLSGTVGSKILTFYSTPLKLPLKLLSRGISRELIA